MRRWIRPFEASMPPSRIAKGMMASGFCRARNAIRMPGIAVAGGERGVGVALDRRHLEHAGKTGESAAERSEADDEALHRQALQQRRADVAAGDAGGEAPGGLFDQDPGEDAAEDAGDEAPMHVHARDVADRETPRRLWWSRACSGSTGRAAVPRRSGSSGRWRCRPSGGWRSSRSRRDTGGARRSRRSRCRRH